MFGAVHNDKRGKWCVALERARWKSSDVHGIERVDFARVWRRAIPCNHRVHWWHMEKSQVYHVCHVPVAHRLYWYVVPILPSHPEQLVQASFEDKMWWRRIVGGAWGGNVGQPQTTIPVIWHFLECVTKYMYMCAWCVHCVHWYVTGIVYIYKWIFKLKKILNSSTTIQ